MLPNLTKFAILILPVLGTLPSTHGARSSSPTNIPLTISSNITNPPITPPDKPKPKSKAKPKPVHKLKWCTLRLIGDWPTEDITTSDEEGPVIWHTYYIYDENAQIVGRKTGQHRNVIRDGTTLHSTLPYPVEIRKIRVTTGRFEYAGFKWEGKFDCVRYFINDAPFFIGVLNDCRREFDCGYGEGE